MRQLAPLTLLAGRTLCLHPSSRIARENLEVFCDTWSLTVGSEHDHIMAMFQMNDLSRLAKESDAAANGRVAAEKQAYMSLPRPGVSTDSGFRSRDVLSPSSSRPTRSFESQTRSAYITDDYENDSKSQENHQNTMQQIGDAASDCSATSEEKRQFAYRISLILDDLHASVPSV